MSLASRLVNTLFPNSVSTGESVTIRDGLIEQKSSAMEEEEMEGRPPYLHVSKTTLQTNDRLTN